MRSAKEQWKTHRGNQENIPINEYGWRDFEFASYLHFFCTCSYLQPVSRRWWWGHILQRSFALKDHRDLLQHIISCLGRQHLWNTTKQMTVKQQSQETCSSTGQLARTTWDEPHNSLEGRWRESSSLQSRKRTDWEGPWKEPRFY